MIKNIIEKLLREPVDQKPLRLWPGVVTVILLWLARFGLKAMVPGFEGFEMGISGSFLGGLLIILWWAFLSRAAIIERWGALVLTIVAIILTLLTKHESMGPLWVAGYVLPVLFLAFVIWAVVSRNYSTKTRRISMAVTILISCGFWILIRSGGIDGDHVSDFNWRWIDTPEELLVAQSSEEQMTTRANIQVMDTTSSWPGFRGLKRDGIVSSIRINTDWSSSPPEELWRKSVGPGWSSFAVQGDVFFTQEQRGDDELVACYSVENGNMIWKHADKARFFESNAGAGPRGTPIVHDGSVYALGATGILNALEAGSGAVLWSSNVGTDSDTETPIWGFSSSPQIVDDLVVVAASGSLIAYDQISGDKRWVITGGTGGYSSPHLMTFAGVDQIVLLKETGAIGVNPSDGRLLWEHAWPGNPIVQPAQMANGDILIAANERSGVRRLNITQGSDGWQVEELWTSKKLKPYFNDFVIHKGFAYGISGRMLVCIDVSNGEFKWNGKNYGGQLVVIADQDLLLVLSEKGQLILVSAAPQGFDEIEVLPAIEGKTWNHPVIVDDLLLVRNAQEMVGYRLALLE